MAAETPAPGQTYAQSLWGQAFDSLSGELKATLNQATTHKRDVLAAVLNAAENQRTISLRKRWKFKRSNGEVVIVRDVLEKIAKWVDCFKAVGDTAVQFDASNASLPWAAVRLLLQCTVNDVQQYGTMVQDLEIVSRIIARYKEFEYLHLGRNSAVQPALETALTLLYTEVLSHLARAINFFSKSAPARLAKSIFWTGEDGIQRIMSQEDEVLKLTKLQDTADLRFLETAVLRLRDQSNINVRRIEEEEFVRMISWLSTLPFPVHHETISQARVPGFGQWFSRHQDYRSWCETSSTCALWLHGITGSSKTHLFSMVVDSLLATNASQPESTPFAYFYCLKTDSEPQRASTDDILASILRQIAVTESQNHVRDFLVSDFQRRSKSARLRALDLPKLTRRECVDLIIQVANEDPVTILVDAIDQIEDEHRYALLECLARVMSEAANVVKVLVTSRTGVDVLSAFPIAREIVISSDKTRDDMSDFIFRKIDDARLVSGQLSSHMRNVLAKALLNGAGEMFLWVQRQIQQLRKIKSEHDLLPALETNILSDLDKLYEDDMSQILNAGHTSRQLAVQIFSWLLYMKAPLTPTALLAAITTASIGPISISPADVSALCSNLVIVDLDHEIVRLAHHSIQEYILRAHQSLFSAPVAHALLASACIKANAHGPPGNGDLMTQLKDFYFYAATHWAIHFENSKVVSQDEELFQEMKSFVFEEDDCDVSLSFEVWLDICKEIVSVLPRDHPMNPVLDAIPSVEASPLFLAAIFGMDGLLTLLAKPERGTDWDQQNYRGHTAIYLAAASGHVSTVSALIEKGVELNVECGAYGSPLYAACFRGHQEIVTKLLQSGASFTCGSKFENVLDAAFHGRHEDIVLSLIRDVPTIRSEAEFEQAIQRAAENGFEKVMEELQKPSFMPFIEKATPNRQKMRVARAIKGGYLHVVQRQLPSNGQDPSTVFPKDSVAIAAFYGHEVIVKLLLDHGMDIEAEGQFGTPLRSASLMNHKSTLGLLLQRGANVKTGELKGNALYVAAMKGNVDVLRVLIEEGADVEQKTGSFGTVLQVASYYGHEDIVEILLDAGADVHAKGSCRDAFHAAAEGGHQEIIMLLLKRGYQFHYPPPRPMYELATPSEYKQLYREASPGRQNHPGSLFSRLSTATAKPQEASREIDVDEDATKLELDDSSEMISDVFSDHRQGRLSEANSYLQRDSQEAIPLLPDKLPVNHPLEVSATAGREEVVEILLTQKEILGISDEQVWGALKAAAFYGHLSVVRLLIDFISKTSSVKDCISFVLDGLNQDHQHILEYALDRASRSGCTEKEVDQLRLKLPSGPEKYKVSSIQPELLISDFQACCTSANEKALVSILESEHQHLLQEKDFSKGVRLAARNGHGSLLKLLFDRGTAICKISIPDEALIGAAGKDLETLRILLSQSNDSLLSARLLGKMTFAACSEGRAEVLDYLVSNLSVDINTAVPKEEVSITDQWHRAYVSSKDWSSPGSSSAYEGGQNPMSGSRFGQDADSTNRLGSTEDAEGSSSADGILEEEVHDTASQDAGGTRQLSAIRFFSPLQIALNVFKPVSVYGLLQPLTQEEILEREPVVQFLLRHGADANALGGKTAYPIQLAAQFCPDSVVRELIEAGADVKLSHEGDSALISALRREMEAFPVTKRLLDAGHPLPESWDEGKQIVEMVLEFFRGDTEREFYHGIDDPDGRFLHAPSLEYVFEKGPGAVLEMLLHHYDTGELADTRYGLVLQMACLLGKKPLVELLLARGVKIDATGYYYGSAIQAAARTGHVEIVDSLLEKGANINILQGRWQTPLRAAIVGGHTQIVQSLIDHGADPQLRYKTERLYINDGERESLTSLQLALKEGHMDIAKALLVADPTLVEKHNCLPHPLILSCQRGAVAMVDLILQTNPSIDANVLVPDRKHRGQHRSYSSTEDASPLHAAITNSHFHVVEKLLSRAADVNLEVSDCYHETPLIVAVGSADLRMIRLLLSAGADINRVCRSGTALSHATRDGSDIAIVEELLAAGATVVGPDAHPNCLQEACRNGNALVVETLLEALWSSCDDPTSIIDQTLNAAAQQEDPNTKILNLLLDYVPPTPQRFLQVCSSGSIPLVTRLLKQGMNVNGNDTEIESPLQVASRNLNLEVVQLLLQQGATIRPRQLISGGPLVAALKTCAAPLLERLEHPQRRWREYFHTTSLDFQTIQRCTDVTQLLLEKGASLDSAEGDFGNSLHLACLIGSLSLVQVLINYGSSLDDTNGYFQTPLFAAIYGNNPDVVSLILDKGCSVNYVHPKFGTALHWACRSRNEQLVRKLLQYGASAAVRDAKGRTAFTVALGASDSFQDKSMAQIIWQSSEDIPISEDDIFAAVGMYNKDMLSSILDAGGDELVSEELIIRILRKHRSGLSGHLELLFDHSGGLAITPKMLMVGISKWTFEMLTSIRPLSCEMTAEILEKQKDIETFQALWNYDPGVKVTEGVIIRVLKLGGRYGNSMSRVTESELLGSLWPEDSFIVVTDRMLKSVRTLSKLEFLLQRLGPARGKLQQVATFVWQKGYLHYDEQSQMLARLIQVDPEIELTSRIVEKVMVVGRATALDTFLSHTPSLPITEKLFISIFGEFPTAREEQRAEFANILRKHDKQFVFTPKIRDAIDRAYQKQTDLERKEMFYSFRERDETEEEAEMRKLEDGGDSEDDSDGHFSTIRLGDSSDSDSVGSDSDSGF
ncbi:hypothetical protein NW762_008272 [Fusarium torreyae]|uniref:Ankyrin n=1 Tax=Fusarium torreyae TaxID=1237075 RepID=A0A9W8RXN7_9HYPO|nr:hypothetical protein NW762_008272 [Fusarium torreyae]